MSPRTLIAIVRLALSDESLFEDDLQFELERKDIEEDLSLPAEGYSTINEE